MRLALGIASLVILSLPAVASAQTLGGIPESGAAFTVSVSPQYPEPFGRAILSVTSSGIDLAGATLVVTIAGREVYRGNVQSVAIPLGAAGNVTSAKVTVSSAGTSESQTVSLAPQDVSIIAEPVSSAPPWYLGKPLVPLEGSVRVVAMANLRTAGGAAIDPQTCSYAWSVDGVSIAGVSGIGKDAILVAAPLQYRSRQVTVVVASPDGSKVGSATLSIAPSKPSVRIYRNDSLLGIRSERALSGNYSLSGAEETLVAAPFSFSTAGGAPIINWFLNGASAQEGATITLRPTGSGEGSASLSVVASADDTRATENLLVSFGSTITSGLFGL